MAESIYTLTKKLEDKDIITYFFGSQVEGTTTRSLNSDTDNLTLINRFNVIQDLSEWERGKHNYLMIQDETVSPGYCFLQFLRDDVPLLITDHLLRDERGRVLLPNTIMTFAGNENEVRHGPAQSLQGVPGFLDRDLVNAFPCKSYPVQCRQWLDEHREGYWPSNAMIQYCSNVGCFVVGVGKRGSLNENREWRISTSLAERCLMFNLNITQIRCYILIKMILKTFITHQYHESISSFMCKTVLFHCISNTRAAEWKENTLLTCLSFCLSTLYNCVINEYCPHFFIPENNLIMRRFSQETKPFILEALNRVIESNGRALLEIEYDNFGLLLEHKLSGCIARNIHFVSTNTTGPLVRNTALIINECFNALLISVKKSTSRQAKIMISTFLTRLINVYHDHMDRKSCNLMAQYLCHTMGTIIASPNNNQRNNLVDEALLFMSLGLNSDVASGKLKLASVFYCTGDDIRTELILKDIEECYDLSVVEPICDCYRLVNPIIKDKFDRLCYESNDAHSLINDITASCVRFVQSEVNCCPGDLRHEMFRSTQEDVAYRTDREEWMDMAVVDSLPFLYFLQYKTYTRLRKDEDRNRALLNLVRTIEKEPNLGHRETALNLLGQCMEKENRNENALKCYNLSLELRERNKAAKYLICRLLSTVLYGREFYH